MIERGWQLLADALPRPWMLWSLGPVMLLYAAAAARFAGWLRVARGVRVNYTRKVFHFFIFTTAGLVQLMWGLPGVALFGTIVAVLVVWAVWRGDGDPFYEAMARDSDRPRRSLFILVPLATTAWVPCAVARRRAGPPDARGFRRRLPRWCAGSLCRPGAGGVALAGRARRRGGMRRLRCARGGLQQSRARQLHDPAGGLGDSLSAACVSRRSPVARPTPSCRSVNGLGPGGARRQRAFIC